MQECQLISLILMLVDWLKASGINVVILVTHTWTTESSAALFVCLMTLREARLCPF